MICWLWLEAALPFAIAAAFGLVVGSFLNVCIWRVPRGGSVVSPPSACPRCGAEITSRDNVPVLSYMMLGGRCRSCRLKISARYPLVEALNAALYVMVYWRFGPGFSTVLYCIFVSTLVVITFIDLDFQIIPDRITLPGIPLGILAGFFVLPDAFERAHALGWMNSLLGAVLGFGLFFGIAVASRGGMGGGDVKMMGMVGAVLGWKGVFLTTFAGSLAGSVYGLLLIALRGGGRKTKVPFGPFLALGALVSLIMGQEIARWYFNAAP